MTEYDKEERALLDRFGDKYAKKEYEYFDEARTVLKNIDYLMETHRRTGLKQRFGLEIVPVGYGADAYWLMKKIITHHNASYWREYEVLARFMRIYDIVLGIAGKLLDQDNKTVNEETFQDFLDFEPVFSYWTNDVEYRDTVLGQIYYGCQTDTSELKKRFDNAKSKITNPNTDEGANQ